jgi:6-pyruvoyltetrahydropterin/6-carboxytetrahydropterin synthase
MTASIAVRHNIEVAHRLFELPGKCEQIHGHSMWVTMTLVGAVNSKGILAGIEYGDLKKEFRGYLDGEYDHRLLLNAADPFARPLYQIAKEEVPDADPYVYVNQTSQVFLPGLQATMGDPTTENIAKWIGNEMFTRLADNKELQAINVEVWETRVNMASWGVSF